MNGLQSLIFLLGFSGLSVAKDGARPNVLFLILDDFRPALGSYGERVITPNMDQLAAQSIRFTQSHAQQAVCAPSRISFLTSRRPDSTLLWEFDSGYWRDVAGNYTTLPQHFKENGYYTLSAGKVFHRGICSNYVDDYPFSWSTPSYRASTKRYNGKKLCPGPDGSLHMYTMCPVNVTVMPEGTLPDIQTADYAIEALRDLSNIRHKKSFKKPLKKGRRLTVFTKVTPHTPFFLAVGFYKPHLPFRYPHRYKDLYPIETVSMAPNPFFTTNLPPVAWEHWKDVRKGEDIPLSRKDYLKPMPDEYHVLLRQAYFATTTYVDHQVGRVLSTLEEEGLADNTIIVLLGDHGWQLGEHQEWSKYSNFASATQVPLIIYVPGVTDSDAERRRKLRKFPLVDPFDRPQVQYDWASNWGHHRHLFPGLSSDALVELVDVFPTLAELAGLTVPPTCPADGAWHVRLCTEGVSLVPVIRDAARLAVGPKIKHWKNATFSQYPRPTLYPSPETNTPPIGMITVMGYSMRTSSCRYSEWLPFNNSDFSVDWSRPLARELYIYGVDPMENANVASHGEHQGLVKELSHRLRVNWRGALPVFATEEESGTKTATASWVNVTQSPTHVSQSSSSCASHGTQLAMLLAVLYVALFLHESA